MGYRPEIVKLVSERESSERVAKLGKFIENVAAGYRKEGIPVGPDGRIDTEAFRGIYSDVEKDKERVREWTERFHGNVSGQEIKEQRLATDGEQLEMLIHAIMHKNLGSRFIVARSSQHDDIHNKVDTVLFDRETGNPICAFDEVGDTKGRVFEDKQTAVRDRNVSKGGVTMKYGLTVKGAGDEKKIVPGAVHNIPIFYVALPQDRIQKGLKEFNPSPLEQSDFEKKLFEYLVLTMSSQIGALELYSGRLDPNLVNRLAAFKKTITEIQAKKK
jgi:hypothetical protein